MKKLSNTAFQFIVGAGIGSGGMILYLLWRDSLMISPPGWIAAISSILLILFIIILVHELGHLIAGFAVGLKFLMISVGPFKIQKTGESIRPGINRHLNAGGGLTLMIPEHNDPDNSKMFWFIAAGPLANFILGIITLSIVVMLSGDQTGQTMNYILYLLFTTGYISIILGLVSIIPSESDAFESDGRQILDMFRGGEKAISKQQLTILSVSILNGTRPREIDKSLLQAVLSRLDSQSPVQAASARFIEAYHLLDCGKFEDAERVLDSLIENLEKQKNPMLEGTLFAEKAFILSAYHNSPKEAVPLLEKARKGYVEKQTLARAEAAYHIACGDIQQGREMADKGLEDVTKSLDKGGAIFETELLQILAQGHLPTPVNS